MKSLFRGNALILLSLLIPATHAVGDGIPFIQRAIQEITSQTFFHEKVLGALSMVTIAGSGLTSGFLHLFQNRLSHQRINCLKSSAKIIEGLSLVSGFMLIISLTVATDRD